MCILVWSKRLSICIIIRSKKKEITYFLQRSRLKCIRSCWYSYNSLTRMIFEAFILSSRLNLLKDNFFIVYFSEHDIIISKIFSVTIYNFVLLAALIFSCLIIFFIVRCLNVTMIILSSFCTRFRKISYNFVYIYPYFHSSNRRH